MSSRPISDEEAVAAADKEMEERANRAKELLSRRYVGLKRQQVCQSNCDYGDELTSFLRFSKFVVCSLFCSIICLYRKPNRAEKCNSNAE